uniref:FG-GAP-like repeat-containing protein n=1 Tax=Microcoleus sp. CAWBG640 TaxID=2841653 RepID=UPI00312B3875
MSAIGQITHTLANQKDIEALHILSHGSPASVNLSTETLNNSNLEKFSPQLKQWGNALTQNADILLYGCEVAAGETGQNFLKRLSEITGANIAASATPTGSAELGGDWNLEVQTGPIAAAIPFNANSLKTYSGVLGLAPKVDFTTGSSPFSVSIGDFNGDNKPDLAVANFNSTGTASILLNTTTVATTPTFATKVDFGTGSNPTSVTIGDFNGDGKPDLATANFSNTASILLNTTTVATTPTFATKFDFPTGTGSTSVSIGDFNGDNKPDLAVSNQNSSNVSILLNTTTTTGATTPTFATKVDFTVASQATSVSIGDFNGDNKPDLALVQRLGNIVSIFLNTTTTGATTPTFATKVDFTTGFSPQSVSIGDINGDGKPDLAVVNSNNSTASILLNTTTTGATTPTFATKVDFTTGSGPRSVSIGDINGDGKPDLAVANNSSASASILLNTTTTGATTPTFATKVDFTTGTNPVSVSIGDINGDGKPDLAVANNGSNTASILLNTTAKVTAVTATTADGSYGVGSTIAITVTFDAAVDVTGTPRLQLETGTTDRFATYVSGSGGTVLTFNYVVQAGDSAADLEYLATNALTLNGGTIKDNLAVDAILTLPTLASPNSLGGSKAIVVDGVVPTVTLASSSTTTVNGLFAVTAAFSEDVTGFDTSDITVGNANISNFLKVNNKTYTFNVTPIVDGNVTVDIPAAKATDTAGNNNTAATQLTRTADFTAPTATINQASSQQDPTTNNLINYTVQFSEPVTGFDATKVALSGTAEATTAEVTGSGKFYNVAVSGMTKAGTVIASINANAVTDVAGNPNTAASTSTDNQVTFTKNTAPVVASAINNQSATLNTAFTYTVPTTTFTDADNDTLTYTATKEDGTALPSWLTFNATTRIFSGTPATANIGNLQVKVSASDGKAATSNTFLLTVSDKPNTAPVVASAINNQSATLNTAFNYTVPTTTFTDADNDTLTYTATKEDGTALPTWLTFNATTRIFNGTPATANIGNLQVKVSASDGKAATSNTFLLTVSDKPNTAPVV